MTTKIFTDATHDTLKVANFNRGGGYLTVEQGTSSGCFELTKDNRVEIAAEILKGIDATVVEGKLPNAVTDWSARGTERVKVNGFLGEISESEREHFLYMALTNLAMANAIGEKLDERKEEKERQERLEANRKRDVRRNELAKQLTSNTFTYLGITDSTRKAIDRIIELEEAAK